MNIVWDNYISNIVHGVGHGDKECWTLKDGAWSTSHHLSLARDETGIWPVEDGLILLGGSGSDAARTTAVLVTHTGDVRKQFTLKYKTKYVHCYNLYSMW